jgi:LCP family protein required for cell wall assembly
MKHPGRSVLRQIAWTCTAVFAALALTACGARPSQVSGTTVTPTELPTQTPMVVTSAPPTQTPVVVTSAPPTATARPQPTSLPETASATTEASSSVAVPALTRTPAPSGSLPPTEAVTATTVSKSVNTPGPTPTPPDLSKTDNILVLGADVRPGPWKINTDSIMAIAIDHEAKQVGILSIPRDLYIKIPGWGDDRINAAVFVGDQIKYPGGGPALARRMVQETIGIPTQHYAIIRMEGLERLVDALGGVTVTLECPLYEQTPDPKDQTKVVNWTLPAGPNFLNGKDARRFATYRYIQSDFGRVRRQQQLIWAIRNRALQLDVIPRIPELWAALKDTFKTDLGLVDIMRLAGLGLELEPRNVHGTVLDQDVVQPWTTPAGGAVLVIKNQETLRKKLAGLFSGQSIADLGKKQGPKCPPPPPGFPNLNPTPAPTAAVEVTPTISATAQS